MNQRQYITRYKANKHLNMKKYKFKNKEVKRNVLWGCGTSWIENKPDKSKVKATREGKTCIGSGTRKVKENKASL